MDRDFPYLHEHTSLINPNCMGGGGARRLPSTNVAAYAKLQRFQPCCFKSYGYFDTKFVKIRHSINTESHHDHFVWGGGARSSLIK